MASSSVSKDPKPMLAKPSVHKIIWDPGLQLPIKPRAVTKAGPKAVLPVGLMFSNYFVNYSALY